MDPPRLAAAENKLRKYLPRDQAERAIETLRTPEHLWTEEDHRFMQFCLKFVKDRESTRFGVGCLVVVGIIIFFTVASQCS